MTKQHFAITFSAIPLLLMRVWISHICYMNPSKDPSLIFKADTTQQNNEVL